ncbi:MAG: alpha-1,2-fucosyltransferase [Patescibacteria group bacterium]|nr:alpha-1,2-fucosyltransferase [Patescibacteria group bacterium]
MIITRLIGGLGNQMFQYAAGRRLAHARGTVLKLDIVGFEVYKLRKYELEYFRINSEIAQNKELDVYKSARSKGLLRFVYKLVPSRGPKVNFYSEKSFNFNKEVLKLPENAYLTGYWQSEKYFKDIEKIIRREFEFKTRPDRENNLLLKKIRSVNSISIHVRRGDLVTNRSTNKYHGVCPISYYLTALKIISEKVKNPHLFIFSDDIPWVRRNFKLKLPVYFVENNQGDHSYEDLRLMQNCKHNIIANSTFSWWAAWLNPNKGKTIVAPKKWFNEKSIDTSDLIPEDWIKI